MACVQGTTDPAPGSMHREKKRLYPARRRMRVAINPRGNWEDPTILLCGGFAILSTEIRLDVWTAKAACLTCLSVGMRDCMP